MQLTNSVVAQRSAYNRMLAPSCGHLNDIECESCKELTGIETQLEERHHQALVKRNYVHSPLIHQFPFEINTCIFLLAFPPQEACGYIPHEKVSPLILTKVCQTWRALALSTPRLWSSISFDTENPNFPLLNHQIAHSGAVPLTIFLASGLASKQERSLANATQAMSIIIKQLHRVVSLYLLFTEEVAMACGSISGLDYPKTAPLLEDLHFHFLDHGPGSFQLRLAIEPPRPRQVTLNSISFDQICLDWSNVSSLTLNSCYVHMLPPTLKSLEHLVLEHTSWVLPGEQPPIVNHSIQHVTLEDSDNDLMLTLTLPSLRTLDVEINDTETFGIVCDFLLRSLCPLQALHIHYAGYDGGDVTRVIQALLGVLEITKELQHLTLRFLVGSFVNIPSSDFEPLVRRFSESSQNRGFLPHLQTLTLETRSILPIDLLLDAMTLDPFPSEIANGPDKERPLRTLNLELYIPLDKVGRIRQDVLVRILQIRAAGKNISITCTRLDRNDLVEHWKSSYGIGDG